MKTKFLTFAFSLMALLSSNVFAVDTAGKVVGYNTLAYGNNFVFSLSQGKVNPVSCDTNSSVSRAFYTIPLNTPWGKTAAASIITAKVTGNSVKTYGTGKCDYWGNTEDAVMVEIQE